MIKPTTVTAKSVPIISVSRPDIELNILVVLLATSVAREPGNVII